MPRDYVKECNFLLEAKEHKIRELEEKIEELQASLGRLPTTADGVAIFGDSTEDLLVYASDGTPGVIALNHETGWVVWPADEGEPGSVNWPLPVSRCYSTREAAHKAGRVA